MAKRKKLEAKVAVIAVAGDVVLDAYEAPGVTKTWCVWCDWCQCWHYHGAGEGHRVGHCVCRRSPYRAGYVLRFVPGRRPARAQQGEPISCGQDGCWNCPAES